MKLFSHVSVVFTVIQNEWLATNSQISILNNFGEYYTALLLVSKIFVTLPETFASYIYKQENKPKGFELPHYIPSVCLNLSLLFYLYFHFLIIV